MPLLSFIYSRIYHQTQIESKIVVLFYDHMKKFVKDVDINGKREENTVTFTCETYEMFVMLPYREALGVPS